MKVTALRARQASAQEPVAPWPQKDLERVTQCPVCGSSDRTLLHEGLTDRVFFCAPGTWTSYACDDCGSAYLDPRPTPLSIGRAYEEYFTHAGDEPTAADQLSNARRLRRALVNGYRNWCFGTHFEPASSLGVLLVLARAFPSLRESLAGAFRYLPKVFPGAQLLDVGAGNGDFLVLARSAGWIVQGVEPDPEAAAVCRDRGLDVRLGGIEHLAGEQACFDFITISHVIEHVHDPEAMLRRAFGLLKPGGCLYVDTPNIDSLGHKRYGRSWFALDPPRHLVLFNWSSLESILRDVGFTHITWLPRAAVYAVQSACSRAVVKGRRDCLNAKPNLGDRIVGHVLAARMLFVHRDSEFVTVLARKAGSDSI